VRKLLVASQKGGVGKTTTSINLAAATALCGTRVLLLDADPCSSISTSLNLAQHPQRRSLRQGGHDLPGVLCCGVIPGLDVYSPYEDGSCSDAELDEVIRLTARPAFQESYGCVIVDAPPFLGANPRQLLSSCDEFLLVMRAESQAYRTLPAFLELVQRARKGPTGIRMRGILLTLPEGEEPNGRYERELRGRFGTRILPYVIPADEKLGQALLAGQIVTQAHPEAPVAVAYTGLAAALQLASETLTADPQAESGLLVAAAHQRDAGTRRDNELDEVAARAVDAVEEAIGSGGAPVAVAPVKPSPRLVSRPRPLQAPAAKTTPTRPRPRPVTREPEHLPELEPVSPPSELVRPSRTAARAPARQLDPAASAPPQPWWLVWTALGTLLGLGLRFVRLPEAVFPLSVGMAVAVFVVLVLKLALGTPENKPAAGTNSRPGYPPEPRATDRGEARKDSSVRLNALARRAGAASRRSDKGRNGNA
jgi:chromosome partitioning protein